jgi:predicted kinase
MKDELVKLLFLCGKMAAGKSTFAKELARERNVVLLVHDELSGALFPGEIQTIQDFVKYAARLREALSLHIQDSLSHGVPVVSGEPAHVTAALTWISSQAITA